MFHQKIENRIYYLYSYDEDIGFIEKKKQIKQAYNKQQKEIADLEEFVARNKARAATATPCLQKLTMPPQ